MKKWEYGQITCPLGQQIGACQQAGQDGWELAAMVPTVMQPAIAVPGQPAAVPGLILMFKRPVSAALNGEGASDGWIYAGR